jgi:hypothetical protein
VAIKTYHRRSEKRKDFQAVQVCAASSRQVVPGCGGKFRFPGVEVCARHCCGGLVFCFVHEAGHAIAVRDDCEEESGGDGLDGVVVGCWGGGGHGCGGCGGLKCWERWGNISNGIELVVMVDDLWMM